ncbi:MAG: helix-turn-helix domain-containing protein [Bdellovibrionia bacterium]
MSENKKSFILEQETSLGTLSSLLKIAQLQAEKCELKEARKTFLQVLVSSKDQGDTKSTMEAIAGLLRLSSEALDEKSIEKWDRELDSLVRAYPKQVPPMVWFCKGAVARYRGEFLLAQRHFHRYLKAFKNKPYASSSNDPSPNFSTNQTPRSSNSEPETEASIARGWIMLATVLQQRGRLKRSLWLCKEVLRRFGKKNYRGINGITYLILGTLFEREKDYKTATLWFKKAHVHFLGEHNWFYHLYALYGYARIARKQQNYPQAHWYLDLVEKAAFGPEFGLLRRETSAERLKLEKDTIDLLVDSRKGIIATRESGELSIGKQYVLLHILEALSEAHEDGRNGAKRGLSKSEIIERVWKETYRPESHDNKLYYNINRLRKLIEPDIRKPQYLLNWKEGYRLAPGLRVQLIEDQVENPRGNVNEKKQKIGAF